MTSGIYPLIRGRWAGLETDNVRAYLANLRIVASIVHRWDLRPSLHPASAHRPAIEAPPTLFELAPLSRTQHWLHGVQSTQEQQCRQAPEPGDLSVPASDHLAVTPGPYSAGRGTLMPRCGAAPACQLVSSLVSQMITSWSRRTCVPSLSGRWPWQAPRPSGT